MPIQTAVDLSRARVRAVEIDGTAKSPRIKSFTAVDVPPPAPPAEGAEGAAEPARHGYAEALGALAAARRVAKDPAGVAIASLDCTFREIDLPFTTAEQIDRVVKFEAESHLQLVDIDSVVVSYQILDTDGRGGSRLMIAACLKETIKSTLADLATIGIDPQSADLHLTALYGALKATGFFVPPEAPAAEAPPDARPAGETVIALECDADLTHLLVVRGDTLVVARALRLGGEHAHAGQLGDGSKGEAGAHGHAPAHDHGHAHGPGHEHDETLVVVDDLGGEEGKGKRGGGDYFARLRREVTRTLLRLGPAAGEPARVLLMGRATRDPAFAGHVQAALHLPVEVVAPYERVAHDLDEGALAEANREGVAALGVALRMIGNVGGSQIEFRREEVRYARRFDQVKVALACFSIALLVAMALLCIERIKRSRALGDELFAATGAVLGEYSTHAESQELYDKVNKGTVKPLDAVTQARTHLERISNDLREQLGRSTSIPRLPGGLDYLNSVITAIDGQLEKIGRLQLTTIDLDVSKEKPTLKLSGIVMTSESVDVLVRAIRSSPAVANVQEPPVSGTKDQRLQFSNLEIDLVPGFDPRSAKEKEDGS